MLKFLSEITDFIVFGRNYCCSCRVLMWPVNVNMLCKVVVVSWCPQVAVSHFSYSFRHTIKDQKEEKRFHYLYLKKYGKCLYTRQHKAKNQRTLNFEVCNWLTRRQTLRLVLTSFFPKWRDFRLIRWFRRIVQNQPGMNKIQLQAQKHYSIMVRFLWQVSK